MQVVYKGLLSIVNSNIYKITSMRGYSTLGFAITTCLLIGSLASKYLLVELPQDEIPTFNRFGGRKSECFLTIY